MPSSSSASAAARFLLPPVSRTTLPAVISGLLHKHKAASAAGPTDSIRSMASGKQEEKEGVAHRIMPHLLNIYGSCATARDFEIYAQNATFEDPLMRAQGVKQIKSAFYSLPKVFSESRIVEYTVREEINNSGIVNNNPVTVTEVLIDNKQQYKVLGKAVELTSLIRLELQDDDDGEKKIVRHEDWWDKKPLKNRDTVAFPLAGRLAEATRRGAMLLTHALMGDSARTPS